MLRPGIFVRSNANDWGVARLVHISGASARLEYFVSPASGAREEIDVPAASVTPAKLFAETRVYCFDPESGTWRAGRLLDGDPIPGAALKHHEDHHAIAFPNSDLRHVPASRVFIRWTRPIDDPTDWLAAAMTETPFWHQGRARFIHFAITQRAAFGGLTALASASVELFRHQIDIVRRVLRDPVQRYLLADEVGLGKTIEAGIILRQYFLDDPAASALVVVPTHLVDQWREELRTKFHLGEELEKRLHVVASTADIDIVQRIGGFGMLVVDEAHQAARWAYSSVPSERRCFDAVRAAAMSARRVLLLSATPLLHNEDAFLAMLHLLDPTVHRLDDLGRFRELVEQRQKIAELFQSLHDDAASLFLEETLDALAELAASDPRMRELCERLQALLEEDDDEARARAIRALRAHIGEIYRLDRRLLRTRRAAKHVADDLPRRVGPHLVYDGCTVRASIGDLLESWRRSASFDAINRRDAVTTERDGALFVEMLESALSHPSKFRAWISRRAADLDRGAQAAFDRERAWLAEHEASIELAQKDDARIHALVQVVEKLRVEKLRSVIFVDDPTVADTVYATLLQRYPNRVLRAPFRAGADLGMVAVVCDRRSEDGLNLQGERSAILHFDLPLSPNRLEQRIGRVDRIGAKASDVRSITLVSRSIWELGWAACLQHGVKVFSRSIASLQYVLDENMRALRGRLLHDGPFALEDAARTMTDGDKGLDRELKRIRAQEMLDSIERSDEDDEDDSSFLKRLEKSDYEDDESQAAVDEWAVSRLRFARRREDGQAATNRYVYVPVRERAQPNGTLLPADHLVERLRRAIDRAGTKHGNDLCTYPMTASRYQAARASTRLLRIGDPFVDGLIALAEADDRGIAWAFWRYVPRYPTKSDVDVFFRFDFVVSAETSAATQVVQEANGLTHAVRRRADEAFSPQFMTVWVGRDGTPVLDPRLLEVLGGEYQKTMDWYADINLRPARWAQLESRGLLQGWESDLRLARSTAEEELRRRTELDARCAEAANWFERVSSGELAGLTSRLARLKPGAARERERCELELEDRLRKALIEGIRRPFLRPDAAGVLFLANWTPFGNGQDE